MTFIQTLKIATAALCASLAITTMALAGPIKPLPDIDVEMHCKDAVAFFARLGWDTKSLLLVCLRQEQEHYDHLKASAWQDATDEARMVCVVNGTADGYQTLDNCLREYKAEEDLKTFKFKK